MKTISIASGLIFFIFLQYLYSQNLQWAKYYAGPDAGPDDAYDMKVDASGNIYVTGSSYSSSSGYDIVTIKYNTAGSPQWIKRYTGTGNNTDIGNAIEVDASGNVYVAGYTYSSSSSYNGILIKYSALGVQEWVKTDNGAANRDDFLYSVGLDAAGNVYVSGMVMNLDVSFSYHEDYVTMKYSPSGVQQWKKTYDGPFSGDDESKAMFVDALGNVYVTGASSSGSGARNDCLTIKYNTAGDIQWTKRYNGPGNGDDEGTDITVDSMGNVCVTGYVTIIAAYTDAITIRYDAAGNLDWAVRYNGSGDSYDRGVSIAADDSLSVFITGYTTSPAGNKDYLTIKYSQFGERIWTATYNVSGGEDKANSIALDISGNVYITGTVTIAGGTTDFATIKYRNDGPLMWDRLYGSQGNFNDKSRVVYVDPAYSVYICGSGTSGSAYTDYLTLKYAQPIGINLINYELPADFSLSQNYPNPFNPVTNIEFSIPNAGHVKLFICDITGRKVETLVNSNLAAGKYKIDWDASKYASGIYFYTITAGSYKETRKMILMK